MDKVYAEHSMVSKLPVWVGFVALAPIGICVIAMGIGGLLNILYSALIFLSK